MIYKTKNQVVPLNQTSSQLRTRYNSDKMMESELFTNLIQVLDGIKSICFYVFSHNLVIWIKNTNINHSHVKGNFLRDYPFILNRTSSPNYIKTLGPLF